MGVGMGVGAKSWWGLWWVGGGSCERSVPAVDVLFATHYQ